jgi:hypothetical protein
MYLVFEVVDRRYKYEQLGDANKSLTILYV